MNNIAVGFCAIFLTAFVLMLLVGFPASVWQDAYNEERRRARYPYKHIHGFLLRVILFWIVALPVFYLVGSILLRSE